MAVQVFYKPSLTAATDVFIVPLRCFSSLPALPRPQDAPRQGRQRVVECEPTTKTGLAADRKKDQPRQMPEE